MSLVLDRREIGPGVSFCRSGFHGRTTAISETRIPQDSSSSSSIGECSNLSGLDDDEEDEVQSRFSSTPLAHLGPLHDSLPMKRGLSNFFSGKSKSFGSLSGASSIKDLAKPENPLNKRRRILLARKISLNGISSQTLLSPASVQEKEEEESPRPSALPGTPFSLSLDEGEEKEKRDVCDSPLPHGREFSSFTSSRSFSLKDFHRI